MAFDFNASPSKDIQIIGTSVITIPVLPPEPDPVVVVSGIDTKLKDIHIGMTPPNSPTVGQLWIDTSELI